MKEIVKFKEFEIVDQIIYLRGQKVMLDFDLAVLYGTENRVLKQAVRRHINRFPDDFVFQLTKEEWKQLITICDKFKKFRNYPTTPFAFTEHGAVMLASVLNSPVAVEASIYVVRAFVKLRDLLSLHKELADKISELEQSTREQFKEHSEQLNLLFGALKQLISEKNEPVEPIGFKIRKK